MQVIGRTLVDWLKLYRCCLLFILIFPLKSFLPGKLTNISLSAGYFVNCDPNASHIFIFLNSF